MRERLQRPQAHRMATGESERLLVGGKKAPSPIKEEDDNEESWVNMKAGQAALVALSVMSVAPDAFAKGGEMGILEGRTLALLHPAMMYLLLGTTAYSGYLGWQWRRVRTVGDEIADLKQSLKDQKGVKKVKEAQLVGTNGSEEVATSFSSSSSEVGELEVSPFVSSVNAQIDSLTEERKELISKKFKDKHFALSSLLLGAGVTFSIEGCLNTFTRTGKLFPGPHLWAGAGITALWAIAAALVPMMQKGNKTAKDVHVALNGLAFCLFLWQVPTGMQIVDKVFQFTKWP